MKLKLLAFGLMFGLLLNTGLAQEESLLDEEESADSSESSDLFGDDFFSDIDSFLELEETTEEDAGDEGGTSEEPFVGDEEELEEITTDGSESVIEDSDEELQSSASTAGSGTLPSSAEVTLSVVNVSQGNADALTVGARGGDVLQYAITLNSAIEDVKDYVPVIDVSGMTGAVEFTETGFGVLNGGNLIYPSYSHQAPCEQTFTFFVRINEDCGELTTLPTSSPEAGTVNVALNCGLSETGPTQQFYLMIGLIMLVLALGFGLSSRGKVS